MVAGSVIFADVEVGSGSQVTNSIVSTAASVGNDCQIVDTVIAERAVISDSKNLEPGTLVFPDERVT